MLFDSASAHAPPPPPAETIDVAPPPPPKPDAPAGDACASPYYIDERGVKKIKPECL
ncbi:MAG TPA: hypothetical protein VFS00_32320 [Polyangiaceae bacterium]|nr:hypothetical protein [Polyangiaceae bacterium]